MRSFLVLFLAFLVHFATAQPGILQESLKVKSGILEQDVEYSIYLPSDYETSSRRYPVLYLLHGFTDDETGWTQFGEAHLIADRCMQSGEAPPMIIVMPDAGVTWYMNSHDGSVRYEDFFFEEFIPFIDKTYRTRPKKEFRAVAGLSMGGHGSFLYALKHPEMFAACVPLSSGVAIREELSNMPMDQWNYVFGEALGKDLEGEARLTEHFYNNYIPHLIETGDAEAMKTVRYYIDCGDDDFLLKGNILVNTLLIDQGVPHEFRVRDGIHDWTYWRTALPEVLKFVGEAFHR